MRYLLIVVLLISSVSYGQTKYYIRADSTQLEKVGGNNELNLLNSTRSRTGAYLKNILNGRTGFFYAVDSAYISGSNLVLVRGGGSQNVTVAIPASAAAWNLTGNSSTTPGTNFLGTTDDIDLVFKTNGNEIGRLYAGDIYSGAFGFGSVATGERAFAFGRLVTASGNNSFATGNGSVASNTQSFATGTSISSGENAVAMGGNNLASGLGSFATGESNISSGQYAFSSGQTDTSSGDYSFTTGRHNLASNNYAFVAGHQSKATGIVSFALGNGLTSSGYNATTFGRTYTNSKDSSFAVGFAGSAGLGIRVFEVSPDSAIISPTLATKISSTLQITSGSPGIGKVWTDNGAGTGVGTWTTPSTVATSVPWSGVTASTADNTINNGAFTKEMTYNSLAGAAGLVLSTTSTAAASNHSLIRASMSGANASSSVVTTAGTFVNDHTGTTPNNRGIYAASSGGGTNYGVYAQGLGGASSTNYGVFANAQGASTLNIGGQFQASGGTTNNGINLAAGAFALNGSAGTSGQVLTSAGANTLPTWSTPAGGSLTVGTTAIASGTAGRILYEGSGNVLQQDALLLWDNTSDGLAIDVSAVDNSTTKLQIGDGNSSKRLTVRSSAGFNIGLGAAGSLIYFGEASGRFAFWNASGIEVASVSSAGDGIFDGSIDVLGVTSTDGLNLDRTITAGGTTGNQTINKMAGTVNIAAAGTTVTVTNSLVDANSIIFCVIRTNDGTATIKNVVPGAGSFVITLAAAATAEVSIGFMVTN